MDINEIRGLSDTDLEAALVDAKHELWKIRFDLATRQEKNYSRLPATRKRIARILTVMTERQQPVAAAAQPAATAPPAEDDAAPAPTGRASRKKAS